MLVPSRPPTDPNSIIWWVAIATVNEWKSNGLHFARLIFIKLVYKELPLMEKVFLESKRWKNHNILKIFELRRHSLMTIQRNVYKQMFYRDDEKIWWRKICMMSSLIGITNCVSEKAWCLWLFIWGNFIEMFFNYKFEAFHHLSSFYPIKTEWKRDFQG